MTTILQGPLARGVPGPAGLYAYPAWVPGLYPKNAVVKHGGEIIWISLRATEAEPSDAVPDDWKRWIDVAVAGDAAASAIRSAEDASRNAASIDALRLAFIQDKAQIVEDRQAVHDDRVAVEGQIETLHAAYVAAIHIFLGPFADDFEAEEFCATQTPPIAFVYGLRYLNSTSNEVRFCLGGLGNWQDESWRNQQIYQQTVDEGAAAVDLASKWATMTDAEVAAGQGYGARKYAGDASGAADLAKDWATKIDAEVVAGQGYGARKYAGDASGAADLSKDWATKVDAEVSPGLGYGARKYAQDALASSTSAAAIAAGLSAGTYTLDGIDAQRTGALMSFPKGLLMLGGAIVLMSSLLTFSSAAKYTTGPDGNFILNAANGPAYTWANGRRQLLIEPVAATNYWLNSETSAGAPSPTVYTAAFTAGMFGAIAGATITSVDGLQHNMTSPVRACAAGETNSFDFICLATADVSSVKLALYGSVAGFGGATQAGNDPIFTILSGPGALSVASGFGTITGLSQTSPTRVRVTRTFAAAQNVTPSYSPMFTAVNQTFKIGGLNFQQGYGSSYIPSGASATARAADVVTGAAGLLALCNGAAVSIALRGKMRGAGATVPYNIMSATGGGDLAQLTKYGGASYGTSVLINQTGAPASITIAGNANDNTADFGTVVSSMIGGKRKLATRGSAVSSDTNPFFKGANTGLNFGSSQSYFACAALEIDEIVAWPIQGSDAGLAAQARVYS